MDELHPWKRLNTKYVFIWIFLNPNQAWIISPSSDLRTGVLYRSFDGGNSWQNNSIPFGKAELFFLDASLGWALADRGSDDGSQAVDIYSTANGGLTWVLIHQVEFGQDNINGMLPFDGKKSGIKFSNINRGWITGTNDALGEFYLFTTQDSGLTWNRQILPLPAGYQASEVTTFPPLFFSSLVGLLPVQMKQVSNSTDFYTTSDGGTTWTSTRPVPVSGLEDCISSLICRVWSGSALASTEDGGITWLQQPTNVNLRNSLAQLDFVTPNIGYALSST